MRRILIAGLLAASCSLGFGAVAMASPIDCPPGQTATKTAGWWDCVNGGDNTSEAQDPKNPNGHPNEE